MLADTDAGNVVVAAQGGALWGYRLLPLILLLIPMLYLVQELTVRLGVSTGRGHAELIRERYGLGWALVAVAGLAAAAIGSLVTEFTGVAGVGEMFGLSRGLTVPMAAAALLAIVGTGSYRRVERAAILIGLFELAFFIVAWAARPNLAQIAADAISLPFGDRQFLYMVASIIGATFNPWMIFYQQSATVDKRLQPADLAHARADTAIGAALTQLLTGAVLDRRRGDLRLRPRARRTFDSVGAISAALTPGLGADDWHIRVWCRGHRRLMVAAIVASLALAWGVGEIAGYKRSLDFHPFAAGWFYSVYALCVAGAFGVWASRDLVWLIVAAQVLNAFLMPLVVGFLVALAASALPGPTGSAAGGCRIIVGICAAVSALGVIGGIADAGLTRGCGRSRSCGTTAPSRARRSRTASRRTRKPWRTCSRRPDRAGPTGSASRAFRAASAKRARRRRGAAREGARMPERNAERLRRDLENLAGRAGRRAGDVPGLAEGRVGRVEQRRRGAGDVRHIGEVVRDVGRADEEGGFALRERADRGLAEIGPGDVRPVEVGRPERRDPGPALPPRPPSRCGSRPTARPASRRRR